MDIILLTILGWEILKWTIRRICKPFTFINQIKDGEDKTK